MLHMASRSVDNGCLNKSVTKANLFHLDKQLIKYQDSIIMEQDKLKSLKNDCYKNLEKVFKSKQTKLEKSQIYKTINSESCANDRKNAKACLNIRVIQSKIVELEQNRDFQKKNRVYQGSHIKKLNNEIKYKHLLAQLSKQRNENDVENSMQLKHEENKN